VLVVAKVGHERAGYYLEHVAASDRDAKEFSERPGRWLGGLTGALGLEGAVEAAELSQVLGLRHPRDGALLYPSASRTRVAAFDCTFTVPKSVSLLFALGPADVSAEVACAHHVAVEASLSYLSENGLGVRRHENGCDRQEPVAGVLVAAFVHRTNRAREPHLHTHALLANLGASADGRLSALDARPLYLNLASVSALYEACLRGALSERVGAIWRARPDGGYELSALPDALVKAFSTRRREILEELRASGRNGARASEIASRRTRGPKDYDEPYEALRERWRQIAYDVGICDSRFEMASSLPLGARPLPLGAASAKELAALVRRVSEQLETPFTKRQLLAECARACVPGASLAALEHAVATELGPGGGLEPLGDRPAMLKRGTRLVPAGSSEAVFRSPRLARLEKAFAHELALLAKGHPRRDDLFEFCERRVVAMSPTRPLETLAALASRARAALRAGLAVRAYAQSALEAATFEALTGISATSGARPLPPAPGCLLLVYGADRLPPSLLVELLVLARERGAPLELVVAPTPARSGHFEARRRLSELATQALHPPLRLRWQLGDQDSPGNSERPRSWSSTWQALTANDGRVELGDLEEAVAFSLSALADAQSRDEQAVLVASDRAIVAELDRLVFDGARAGTSKRSLVVHAPALGSLAFRPNAILALGRAPMTNPSALEVVVRPLVPTKRPLARRALVVGREVASLSEREITRVPSAGLDGGLER
jgi:conjugative relaxase-like TrwC/TraI family protein